MANSPPTFKQEVKRYECPYRPLPDAWLLSFVSSHSGIRFEALVSVQKKTVP